LCDLVEGSIRREIPEREMDNIWTTSDCPTALSIFTHGTSGLIGACDADMLMSLKETHQATADYLERLRETLPRDFSPELFVEDSTGWQGRFRATF